MHTKADSDCYADTSYVNDQIPSPPSLLPNPALPKLQPSTITCSNYLSSSISTTPQEMPCLTSANTNIIGSNRKSNSNNISSSSSSNSRSSISFSNSSATESKSSPYSLWAEYFDSFPVLTEFDLRAGAANSTGSSVVSSAVNSSSPSSSSEESSWSTSIGSGSPFSDCDGGNVTADDSPFDDNSVIDEIVQTLKMDGYNFDHLGDDIIDLPPSNCHQIKREHADMVSPDSMCYLPTPNQNQIQSHQQQPTATYMSLSRTKSHQPNMVQTTEQPCKTKPAIASSSCQPLSINNSYLATSTNMNYHQTPSTLTSMSSSVSAAEMSILDQIVEEGWGDELCENQNDLAVHHHNNSSGCTSESNSFMLTSTRMTTTIPLPPLSTPLQQIQQQQHHLATDLQQHHLSTDLHQQQLVYHPTQYTHQHGQQNPGQHIQATDTIPTIPHTTNSTADQHHHITYSLAVAEDCTSTNQFSSTVPVFPGAPPLTSMENNPQIGEFEYLPSKPVTDSSSSQISLEESPATSNTDKPAHSETKVRRRRSTNSSSSRVEKPHVCKECGAAFKLSANLKQHQVIHTGEKPFSCQICNAMFTRLSSLKTHHRLHTGEKPHICPYCSSAFADRSAMKAHKRIHTGERPYKCQVCSTSFTQLSHLNAHKRTHTGEKPYACSVCNTTFKQLGHLKRHEKSHVCNRL